jgi:hypothetical protein
MKNSMMFLAATTVSFALGATRGLAEDVLVSGDAQVQARSVLTATPNSRAVTFGRSSGRVSGRPEIGTDAQAQARDIVRGSPHLDENEGSLQLAMQASLQAQPAVHAKSRASGDLHGDVQDMAAKILLGHGL